MQIVFAGLAPDFVLRDADGNVFSLSGFRGKIVILNFFASSCSACRAEMGELKVVRSQFDSRVVMISVSMWERDTDEVLRQFRISYNISWILAGDTANVYKSYGLPSVPALITVDQDGNIAYRHSGFTNASVLVEIIEFNLVSHALLGDIDGNEKVDIVDAVLVALAYGSHHGDEKWNEAADFNRDGVINILDLVVVGKEFGKTVS